MKLEYRSLLRYAEKEIPFDEIEGISVQRSRGTRTTTYRVALKRKDGTVVPFRRYYSSASGKYMRQAQALRDFIGVEAFDDAPRPQADPSVQPFLERPRETNGVRWQLVPGRNFGPRWHSVDFKTQDVFVCVMQKSANQSSLGGFGARQGLKAQGFEPADTPGFEQSDILEPFDPMIDPCFVVCTNAPDAARWVLNPKVTQALADWAGHHPLKMFNRPSSIGQLVALFSPNGVFLGTWNLSNSEQVNELAALGAALVNSQKRF